MVDKRNIFLIGPMGAGKSTIGRQLARYFGMDFYDSDQEIEKRTGVDISWIFDIEGEYGFRNREKKIISELTKKHSIVLATGGGSIKVRENRNMLSARGLVIYLNISIEKQILRTRKDKNRPILQLQSSQRETFEKLALERNHFYEEIADFTVFTDSKNIKTIMYQIVDFIEHK